MGEVRSTLRIGSSAAGIALVLALLVGGGILLASGNLGYASHTATFSRGMSGGHGMDWGLRTWWFGQGQELVVEYDVEIRRGSLWVHVFPYPGAIGGKPDPRLWRRVTVSGSGTLAIPIPESGLYRIVIKGSPDGDGYDLDYTVHWGWR